MGKLISLIYFYLVSVIGIILLIIGLYNGVSYVVNVTQYDLYPTRYAGNDDCSYLTQPAPPKPAPGTDTLASISAEEQKTQKTACEKRVALDRKQHKVDNIKDAIFFTLVGIILLALHFPVAIRRSGEK
jgi:hypothetical protein